MVLNSNFGYRQDPIDAVRRFHQGQDFSVPTGTLIFAPADGIVKRAYYIGGLGIISNLIMLQVIQLHLLIYQKYLFDMVKKQIEAIS